MDLSSQERTETFTDYCQEVGGSLRVGSNRMIDHELICEFEHGELGMEADGSVKFEGSLGEVDFRAYGWSGDLSTSRHGELFMRDLNVDVIDSR